MTLSAEPAPGSRKSQVVKQESPTDSASPWCLTLGIRGLRLPAFLERTHGCPTRRLQPGRESRWLARSGLRRQSPTDGRSAASADRPEVSDTERSIRQAVDLVTVPVLKLHARDTEDGQSASDTTMDRLGRQLASALVPNASVSGGHNVGGGSTRLHQLCCKHCLPALPSAASDAGGRAGPATPILFVEVAAWKRLSRLVNAASGN